MNILAAFDKFKDAMPAERACDAALSGALEALGEPLTLCHTPLTDGGEGFCPILTQAASGYVWFLYTSDAADELRGVDLGGRRIIKKKKCASICGH